MTMTLDRRREELQGHITQLEGDISTAEVVLGDASLAGESPQVSQARQRLQDFKEHLEAERLALDSLGRAEAEVAERQKLRQQDEWRFRWYVAWAEALPHLAEAEEHMFIATEARRKYLEAKDRPNPDYHGGTPNSAYNNLISLKKESPSVFSLGQCHDVDLIRTEAEHFRALAAELRAKLNEEGD